MKIVVKIYGALQTKDSASLNQRETEIELPDNATSVDLLSHLGLQDHRHAAVVMDGRILQAGDKPQAGKTVRIFPIAYGG